MPRDVRLLESHASVPGLELYGVGGARPAIALPSGTKAHAPSPGSADPHHAWLAAGKSAQKRLRMSIISVNWAAKDELSHYQ